MRAVAVVVVRGRTGADAVLTGDSVEVGVCELDPGIDDRDSDGRGLARGRRGRGLDAPHAGRRDITRRERNAADRVDLAIRADEFDPWVALEARELRRRQRRREAFECVGVAEFGSHVLVPLEDVRLPVRVSIVAPDNDVAAHGSPRGGVRP